jgi:hypothetical protein
MKEMAMLKSFAARCGDRAFVLAVAGSLAACAVTPTEPAGATGRVEVKFTHAEKYTDAGRYVYDSERTLKAMGEFLQSLGKQLPAGQTLRLEVLDLDLAGNIEPVRQGELRVMRGRADWPRMSMRYSLQGPGTAEKAGEARIADINYLYDSRGPGALNGELAYEKRMIQRWFHDTLLVH